MGPRSGSLSNPLLYEYENDQWNTIGSFAPNFAGQEYRLARQTLEPQYLRIPPARTITNWPYEPGNYSTAREFNNWVRQTVEREMQRAVLTQRTTEHEIIWTGYLRGPISLERLQGPGYQELRANASRDIVEFQSNIEDFSAHANREIRRQLYDALADLLTVRYSDRNPASPDFVRAAAVPNLRPITGYATHRANVDTGVRDRTTMLSGTYSTTTAAAPGNITLQNIQTTVDDLQRQIDRELFNSMTIDSAYLRDSAITARTINDTRISTSPFSTFVSGMPSFAEMMKPYIWKTEIVKPQPKPVDPPQQMDLFDDL